MSTFRDHFSQGSAAYAAHRPTYPAALIDWLADNSPVPDSAWDCGCGTGQLAVPLAARFDEVIATDASAAQIEAATPHRRVSYRVAPADASGLPDRRVDLIVAAQAAHWFDLPAFYAEAQRVVRPGALLALVSYGVLQIDDTAITTIFDHFYREIAGSYWPPERAHVDAGYRSLDFPFAELPTPEIAIELHWDLAALTGYISTWSATLRLVKAKGEGPLEQLSADLASVWGSPERAIPMRFPIAIRAARL